MRNEEKDELESLVADRVSQLSDWIKLCDQEINSPNIRARAWFGKYKSMEGKYMQSRSSIELLQQRLDGERRTVKRLSDDIDMKKDITIQLEGHLPGRAPGVEPRARQDL